MKTTTEAGAPTTTTLWRCGGRQCGAGECDHDEDTLHRRATDAGFIHPSSRLRVSRPTDPAEREAEAVADRVSRGELAMVHGAASGTGTGTGPAADPETGIASVQVGGEPLDVSTRTFMEQRFHHDFASVRVHRDNAAATTARSVRAEAFTVGTDIAFAGGRYQPATQAGRHLLAHELTHVVQQSRAGQGPAVQRQPVDCTAGITGVPAPRDPVAELTAAHERALDAARTALQQVEAVRRGQPVSRIVRRSLDFHFATPSAAQLTIVANRYRGIITRLSGGTRIYRCNVHGQCGGAGSDTYATQRCPAGGNRARICPDFFTQGMHTKVSTLVHEAAHAVGVDCTGNEIYITEPNYPGPNPTNSAEPYGEFAWLARGIAGPIRLPARTPGVPPPVPARPAPTAAQPVGPSVPAPRPEPPPPSFIERFILERNARVRDQILESVEEVAEAPEPREPGEDTTSGPAATAAASPPAAAPPQARAPYYISFTHVAPPPEPDHSRENPGPSAGDVDRAGYTRVRVKPRMTISWGSLPESVVDGVRTLPVYVRSANIYFHLDPVEVFVSSRYRVGSCPYRVTRRHEYEHVAAFLSIFRQHREAMVRRANAVQLPLAASPRHVPATAVDSEQDQLAAPLVQAVREVRGLIGSAMRADRNVRDAPAAYRAIHGRCPADEW